MAGKLLEGIRAIDFGWVATMPLTTKYLSDFGAEVIKVEGGGRVDTIRNSRGKDGISGLNRSGYFNEFNSGKLGLTVNIAQPKGVELIKRLVAVSDIVADNFSAGTMERRGLGYEELTKINPGVIMISSCVQGHSGPRASGGGGGIPLSALSGFNQITGWPDRKPANTGFYTDLVGPHFHILAIMAALEYRRRTGKGQYLDMSQYESALQFMAPLLLDYGVNGRIAERMGNRCAYAAPHAAYRCRGEDRWCTIGVFTDEEWQSFGKVIGSPAWTKDPKFGTLLARKQNEDELNRLVEQWTISHTAEEVMDLMQKAGVPAAVVATGEDLMEHNPQLKHQNFFPDVDHPEMVSFRGLSPAFSLSKAPFELKRAPLLGEHNEYVFKEVLGMPEEEFINLIIEGVIK